MAAHKHKCNMNYSGKSGGMEWSAAVCIDIGVTVRKIESVNHVCKRFRKALENLMMTYVKLVNG